MMRFKDEEGDQLVIHDGLPDPTKEVLIGVVNYLEPTAAAEFALSREDAIALIGHLIKQLKITPEELKHNDPSSL